MKRVEKNRKEKGLKIRWYVTGVIWIALVISTVITAVLFAVLNYFLNLPKSLSTIGWLLLFNGIIAGVITGFLNGKVLAPITRLSGAMTKVSEGDFTQSLSTNSRIDEVRESYRSFNIMTKELAATELLQKDFVSNVSHEFKTPINAIEGYTTLLQGEELSKEQQECVDKILFNTGRLSGLVGNILLLSRLEHQSIPMKQESYRLDEQIRQAILSLENKWSEKDIEFQVEMDSVNVTGQAGLFMHVWLNLLDNAIKFSPEKGVIAISLLKKPEETVFTIADDGPGISEESRKRIFDQFYQADGSHRVEGNGLGLALVKRIVDLNRGSISVKNRDYGGCEFKVSLPAADLKETAAGEKGKAENDDRKE